jgi:hypothetical protein
MVHNVPIRYIKLNSVFRPVNTVPERFQNLWAIFWDPDPDLAG